MNSSSTADEEAFFSDSDELIEGYKPFIGDQALISQSAPFSIPKKDQRSEEEVERIRHSLRIIGSQKEFTPPLRLSDFCLIAKQKWDNPVDDAEESEILVRVCSIH